MGIKEANIYLDNQWNTYYAGQTVNGRIEYVFDSPKQVRGVHVKFKGEAHTEWHESKQVEDAQGKTQSTDTMHTGHEEYFQISYYLLGSNTGNEITIPAGKQVYSFSCSLPPVLPSSFEGEHGYVRYTVKVTLDRPWKFDQETKMAFTVINTLDLNLNPSYKAPIRIQLEKTFCCLCCASPPMAVDVQAPVSGYCPGQVIPIQIDVDNKSNVQLHLVKIYLRKVVTYRATSPGTSTKRVKARVLSVQEGPAPAGTTKHWTLSMEVPPLPPSNLLNCSIIDLDYDFKVECVVSGMHCNMDDKRYITIGTVPLVGLEGQPVPAPAPAPGPDSVPTASPQYPAPQYPTPQYPAPQYPTPQYPAPQYPTPQYPAPQSPSQPAVLPVPAGLPAQPYPPPPAGGAGDSSGSGWVVPSAPPFQELYPTLTAPVYKESQYPARTIQERGESAHVGVAGPAQFAPHYPTYAAVLPPPLPR